MDQGIAGVIAGIAGLVGAGIGGLATAYGARIGAQKSMEAVQIQVQRQSAAEHEHWVRDHRRHVCTEITDAYAQCVPVVTQCFQRMDEQDAILPELMDSLVSAVDGLITIRGHAQLWGPQELEDAAFLLTSALNDLTEKIKLWPAIHATWDDSAMAELRDACGEEAERVTEARRSFLNTAYRTLAKAQ
ncbi:hypothetical protein ACFYVK_29675 [Streptomyces chartreusis]|uniref:hypothetical protein n=1 Tax=Streptomyces chartreusis TaxID=1969 RepID=UPI0036778E44